MFKIQLLACTDKGQSKETDTKTRFNKFAQRLQYEMQNNGIKKVKQYMQFYFPIIASTHYYLLCINMYNSTLDIVDNRMLPMDVKMEHKYLGHLEKMVKNYIYFVQLAYIICSKTYKYSSDINISYISNTARGFCMVFKNSRLQRRFYQCDKDFQTKFGKDEMEKQLG